MTADVSYGEDFFFASAGHHLQNSTQEGTEIV